MNGFRLHFYLLLLIPLSLTGLSAQILMDSPPEVIEAWPPFVEREASGEPHYSFSFLLGYVQDSEIDLNSLDISQITAGMLGRAVVFRVYAGGRVTEFLVYSNDGKTTYVQREDERELRQQAWGGRFSAAVRASYHAKFAWVEFGSRTQSVNFRDFIASVNGLSSRTARLEIDFSALISELVQTHEADLHFSFDHYSKKKSMSEGALASAQGLDEMIRLTAVVDGPDWESSFRALLENLSNARSRYLELHQNLFEYYYAASLLGSGFTSKVLLPLSARKQARALEIIQESSPWLYHAMSRYPGALLEMKPGVDTVQTFSDLLSPYEALALIDVFESQAHEKKASGWSCLRRFRLVWRGLKELLKPADTRIDY